MKRTIPLLFLLCAGASPAQELPKALDTRPVSLVEPAHASERAGRLRPLGMLELPETSANGLRLSQLSGLAWDEDEQILYAISDKGALFHLRPLWHEGKLRGMRLLRAVALKEANGKALKEPRVDSEGLDILKGRNRRKGDAELVVSFERAPRIARFRPDGTLIGEYPLPAPLDDRGNYRRGNKSLEAVCVDDKLGVLTLPEEPLVNERVGSNRVFRLDSREGGRSGPSWPSRGTTPSLEGGGTTPGMGEVERRPEQPPRVASGTAADDGGSWPVPLAGRFRPSAIECLGDGRVLILERDFGSFTGRAVALRRATLRGDGRDGASATVETVALLNAADGWQIDNFEGLARHKENRFFMVSDNNDLFVQRTLLLYFELREP